MERGFFRLHSKINFRFYSNVIVIVAVTFFLNMKTVGTFRLKKNRKLFDFFCFGTEKFIARNSAEKYKRAKEENVF